MDQNPYKSPGMHDGRRLRFWSPMLAIVGVAILGAIVGGILAGGIAVLASALWWIAYPTNSFDEVMDLQIAALGFGSVSGWSIALIVGIWRAASKSQ